MYISVDPKSSVPLYVQVKEQLHLAVATGALRTGDQVPTVRDLAARLRVNPNTIARVYRELQTAGLFASRQGSGTFVSENASSVSLAEGRAILRQRLAEAATMGRSLGLDAGELHGLLDSAWGAAALAPGTQHTVPKPWGAASLAAGPHDVRSLPNEEVTPDE